MHSLIALIIGLTFLGCGFLLKKIGAGGSRNPVMGYRTPRSMKSPKTWTAANLYAAKALHIAGAVILFCGALLWWKPLPQYNELVILGLVFAALAVIIGATETYLKRHFNTGAAPKIAPSRESLKTRPKLPYTRLEWFLELVSLTGVLLSAALLFYHWPRLPDLVPRHYNFRGVVDGWGGKGTLLALPVITFVFYFFLTLLRLLAPLSSREKTAPRSLRLGMDLLAWIKILTIWIFTYLTCGTVMIALGRATALAPLILPLLLVFTLTLIAVYCVLILRAQENI